MQKMYSNILCNCKMVAILFMLQYIDIMLLHFLPEPFGLLSSKPSIYANIPLYIEN